MSLWYKFFFLAGVPHEGHSVNQKLILRFQEDSNRCSSSSSVENSKPEVKMGRYVAGLYDRLLRRWRSGQHYSISFQFSNI